VGLLRLSWGLWTPETLQNCRFLRVFANAAFWVFEDFDGRFGAHVGAILGHLWAISGALMPFYKLSMELSRIIMFLRSEHGPWVHYEKVLMSFMDDLSAGWKKKCTRAERARAGKKRDDDRARLKKIPSITEMQKAIEKAYITMKALADHYKHATCSMSKQDRILANAIMAGAMLLDTFMGRKKEWEILDAEYVKQVLDMCQDFIECKDHKTHRTYGDIAKWLSPGLMECMRAYMAMPRPGGVTTFLVPSKSGATHVHIPSLLATFARIFLPSKKTPPTVNIIRKMFHTTLMKLTSNEEKLKDVMVIIDAHSKFIQDKCYILREPEEDVKLAKLLFQTVVGKSVPWPADENAPAPEAALALLDIVYASVDVENDCDAVNDDEDDEDADDDEIADEYQHWPEGFVFGIDNCLGDAAAMPPAPIAYVGAGDALVASMDVDDDEDIELSPEGED